VATASTSASINSRSVPSVPSQSAKRSGSICPFARQSQICGVCFDSAAEKYGWGTTKRNIRRASCVCLSRPGCVRSAANPHSGKHRLDLLSHYECGQTQTSKSEELNRVAGRAGLIEHQRRACVNRCDGDSTNRPTSLSGLAAPQVDSDHPECCP
jgi:hypothetical protein